MPAIENPIAYSGYFKTPIKISALPRMAIIRATYLIILFLFKLIVIFMNEQISNKNLKFGLIATEGNTDTSLWTNFSIKKKTQLEKVLFKFNNQKKLAAIALLDSINNSRIEDSLAAIKDTGEINIPISSDYFFQTTFPRTKSEKTIPINIQTANGNQIIYLSEKKKNKRTDLIETRNSSKSGFVEISCPDKCFESRNGD